MNTVIPVGQLGAVAAVAILVLTGCTSTTSHGDRATPSGPPTKQTSPGTPTATPSATADPRTPPQLLQAEKAFIRAGGRTGPHAFPEIPQIQKGTLEVGVICSGSGTIDVNVGSIVSYTVVCANGDPGQLNEVGLRRIHTNVAVSVTTKTHGMWGLSVGWTKSIASPS